MKLKVLLKLNLIQKQILLLFLYSFISHFPILESTCRNQLETIRFISILIKVHVYDFYF